MSGLVEGRLGGSRDDPEVASLDIPLDPAQVTAEQMNKARRQTVKLIYRHVWLSTAPSGWDKGWNLARELDTWNRLAKAYGPVQVNGALSVFREALEIPSDRRWSLRYFARRDRHDRIRDAIRYWEKKRMEEFHRDSPLRNIRNILRRSLEDA